MSSNVQILPPTSFGVSTATSPLTGPSSVAATWTWWVAGSKKPTGSELIFGPPLITLRSYPLHRRRQELHGHQRRARRRRLPHHLDQSRKPRHHRPSRRPGRDHQRQRRPILEFLVQPTHRAVLSRHH